MELHHRTDVTKIGSCFCAGPDRQRIEDGFPRFVEHHHPYIRTIVLRTRDYLEQTIDPETNEPYLAPVRVRLHGESDADAIRLPPFLEDAYHLAEEFCQLLAERANTGFFRTLLLRRMGSTMEAGRRTVERILNDWEHIDDTEEDDDSAGEGPLDPFRTLTGPERDALLRLQDALEANRERDPKYAVVRRVLVDEGWLQSGCIVFSQYFDSIQWLADQLTGDLPDEPIGVYAGANRSGTMRNGAFAGLRAGGVEDRRTARRTAAPARTDAASEGLNLQRLGSLVNLDLPWNPSRLEQRKGRIQRIGQVRSEVDVYNMRYANSVEDRVRELLSERQENIFKLFGPVARHARRRVGHGGTRPARGSETDDRCGAGPPPVRPPLPRGRARGLGDVRACPR